MPEEDIYKDNSIHYYYWVPTPFPKVDVRAAFPLYKNYGRTEDGRTIYISLLDGIGKRNDACLFFFTDVSGFSDVSFHMYNPRDKQPFVSGSIEITTRGMIHVRYDSGQHLHSQSITDLCRRISMYLDSNINYGLFDLTAVLKQSPNLEKAATEFYTQYMRHIQKIYRVFHSSDYRATKSEEYYLHIIQAIACLRNFVNNWIADTKLNNDFPICCTIHLRGEGSS